MRIRRHLFFYNTVSVLAALVVMLAVNGAAANAIGRYYQRQAEEVFWELQNDGRPAKEDWPERGRGELEFVDGTLRHRPEFFGRPRPQTEAMTISLLLSGGTAIVVVLLLNKIGRAHV